MPNILTPGQMHALESWNLQVFEVKNEIFFDKMKEKDKAGQAEIEACDRLILPE